MAHPAFDAHCSICGMTRAVVAVRDGTWFRMCLYCDAPPNVISTIAKGK